MSASNPPADSSTSEVAAASLKIWSCVICRRRKVKCDRIDPCSNCAKAGIECHYPVTGRIPRRSREASTSAWSTPAQKQAELLSRLRRLEAVVTELAGQVEDGSGSGSGTSSVNAAMSQSSSIGRSSSSPMPRAPSSDGRSAVRPMPNADRDASVPQLQAGSEFDEEFGRLVVDKDGGIRVGNRFWSVFCNEVDHIFEAMHDVTDSAESTTEPGTLSSGTPRHRHQAGAFVFQSNTDANSLDSLSPLPSQMLFIWQTYVDNVDPFLKILHVPSMDTAFRALKGSLSSLGSSMKPLLFAICLAAITSMNEESVLLNFNASKGHLVERYRLGTEKALGQAGFLVTREIAVVQAFVIYLTILVQVGDIDLAWPLTGALLRIAKSLGLHSDAPSLPNRDVLDVELRRRLWWHICFLDSKSQKPGTRDLSISETSFDTKLPCSLDDRELDSTQRNIPTAQKPSTRLIPCLVRCELWRLVRSLEKRSHESLPAKLEMYYATRGRITETYLNHLRHEIALEGYIKTMGSLFFAKAELAIHTSSSSSRSYAQGSVHAALQASIIIIRDSHALATDPAWAQWRWQLAGQVPWHAMGIFLGQACRQPWGPESERVWVMAKQLLDPAIAALGETKEGPLWIRLMELVERTEKHREEAISRGVASATDEQRKQVPRDISADQIWGIQIMQGPEASRPNHPVIQSHSSYIQSPARQAEHSSDLTRSGINTELKGNHSGIQFPASGLHSESTNPTLWSPTVEFGSLGMTSPTAELVPGEELIAMDWDDWGGALEPEMETMWDFL
ncbi:fungal-specific transcription factor domain-containing protein [Mariannaea sp. PMI_226]|nr:fungal-specific transcription factor domain-containing protein [Mariannaea sp. PMI_226]